MKRFVLAFASVAVIVVLAVNATFSLQNTSGGIQSSQSNSKGISEISMTTYSAGACFGLTASQMQRVSNAHVAIIEPFFTSSAYKEGPLNVTHFVDIDGKRVAITSSETVPIAFYGYYDSYIKNPTQSLNTSVITTNYWDDIFVQEIESYGCGFNVTPIPDTLVSTDSSTLSRYSVVIVPFEEYMTQSEYNALRDFVANGGLLISVNGDSFSVLVGYSSSSNHVWLIMGRGYVFNGINAIPSSIAPFQINDSNWLGSYMCCYDEGKWSGSKPNEQNYIGSLLSSQLGTVLWSSYFPHEDARVTNFTDTSMISTGTEGNGIQMSSYVHNFGKGQVIVSGIDLDFNVADSNATKAFILDSILYATSSKM